MPPSPPSPSRLGRRIAAGAAWMVALQVAQRAVGVVSLTIVARILLPADFGLVALAMTIVAFFEMFGQTQVDVALIANPQADRTYFDSAWTLDLMRRLGLAVILAATAGPMAAFFAEARLEPVLYAIAAIQVVASVENIGVVAFQKDLRFGSEFVYRFASRLGGTILTIATALAWRNHWALVAGIGLQTACRVTLSYAMSGYRPRPSFARLAEIFHFSKWVAAQNLLYSLREQAPVIVIGKLANVDALGLFNLAKEIAGLVTTELRAPVRRALYPGFARMAVETGALRAGFLDAFAIMLLLSLPAAVGLYMLAPLVVEVFLGPRWTAAVPLLEILAAAGIVQSFGTSSHLVYNRIGRPWITAAVGAVALVAFLPALAVGAWIDGARGAAVAVVGTSCLVLALDFLLVRRILSIGMTALMAHAWRPALAAGCMAVVLAVLRGMLGAAPGLVASLLPLLAMTAAGAAVYALALYLTWRASGAHPGAERHVMEVLGGIRRPRAQPRASY